MAFWLLPFYRKLTLHEFKSRLFPKTLIFPPVIWSVASHEGVFWGSSYFVRPHKRLLNREQHSFPKLSQSHCTFQILEG